MYAIRSYYAVEVAQVDLPVREGEGPPAVAYAGGGGEKEGVGGVQSVGLESRTAVKHADSPAVYLTDPGRVMGEVAVGERVGDLGEGGQGG